MGTSQRQITEDSLRRLFYDLEALIGVLSKQTAIQADNALRALNAGQVTMATSVSITVVVNAPPLPATFLIENTTLNLMQVTFVNDDAAVPVYIADKDVVIPAGDLLDPRQRLTYNLRRGQKKYGISALGGGPVNVIVNRAESALNAVTIDAVNGNIFM